MDHTVRQKLENAMAITLSDILAARKKFGDVRIAHDVAINAFVSSLEENARYEVNPGLFAERRSKAQADEARRTAVRFLVVYHSNVPDYVADDRDGVMITNHLIERALAIVGPEERHKEFCREVGFSVDEIVGMAECERLESAGSELHEASLPNKREPRAQSVRKGRRSARSQNFL